MPENGDARNLGKGLLQERQTFAGQLGGDEGESGDVPARTSKTGNESRLNRIDSRHHDCRDRRRHLLRGERRRRPSSQDDVDLETQQFTDDGGQSIELPPDPSPFDGDVLPFDVAEFP